MDTAPEEEHPSLARVRAQMQKESQAKAQQREAEELTLRDRFAMAALTGLSVMFRGSAEEFAEMAYKRADAMLQARKEKG